jgi:type II secretory pathway pseudopilin PulG
MHFPFTHAVYAIRGFSLTEVGISLGVISVLLMIALPSMVGVLNNSEGAQKKARVEILKTQLRKGYNTALAAQSLESISLDTIMEASTFTKLHKNGTYHLISNPPVSDNGTVNAAGTSTDHYVNINTHDRHMYLLPSGGKIITMGHSFGTVRTACGTNDNIALRLIYDPDGKVATDNVDAIHLYVYADGKVRTLETALPNTCARPSGGGAIVTINPIAGADPVY